MYTLLRPGEILCTQSVSCLSVETSWRYTDLHSLFNDSFASERLIVLPSMPGEKSVRVLSRFSACYQDILETTCPAQRAGVCLDRELVRCTVCYQVRVSSCECRGLLLLQMLPIH